MGDITISTKIKANQLYATETNIWNFSTYWQMGIKIEFKVLNVINLPRNGQ